MIECNLNWGPHVVLSMRIPQNGGCSVAIIIDWMLFKGKKKSIKFQIRVRNSKISVD